MLKILAIVLLSLFHSWTFAANPPSQPLSPEQAFQLNASLNEHNQLTLKWDIAPGYYLYRNQLVIATTPLSKVKIKPTDLPVGLSKKDDIRGEYKVYADALTIPILIEMKAGVLDLDIGYQGCSVNGFCYAPIKKALHVDLAKIHGPQDLTKHFLSAQKKHHAQADHAVDAIENLFASSSQMFIVLSFFGIGLLLAFTPCVLPMVPILSGIIIGLGHHASAKKAFSLSLVYVIGMAMTYALAGMLVAMAGSHIQTWFQQAWIIVLFSGLFVVLAFSMFGYYELELPRSWQCYITAVSNKQKGGTYLGVFLMGMLSTLIVSPCVSAPLVGVLTYIAQTGNIIFGGITLLAMGFGMGAPLLLLGMSAGKLLPKAGAWMEWVKKIFGMMMLGLAIWMLSRVLPGPVVLALWSVLAICVAVYLGVFSSSKNNWQKISRGLGVFLLIYGVILMSGAAMGNANPLSPWKTTNHDGSTFVILKDQAQLEQAFASAKKNHQPVLLDFYADWCVSCVKMDKDLFAKKTVQDALKDFVLLRVDITKNNAFDQSLLKKFNVIAPPTILFFNPEGEQYQKHSGELEIEEFLQMLK